MGDRSASGSASRARPSSRRTTEPVPARNTAICSAEVDAGGGRPRGRSAHHPVVDEHHQTGRRPAHHPVAAAPTLTAVRSAPTVHGNRGPLPVPSVTHLRLRSFRCRGPATAGPRCAIRPAGVRSASGQRRRRGGGGPGAGIRLVGRGGRRREGARGGPTGRPARSRRPAPRGVPESSRSRCRSPHSRHGGRGRARRPSREPVVRPGVADGCCRLREPTGALHAEISITAEASVVLCAVVLFRDDAAVSRR